MGATYAASRCMNIEMEQDAYNSVGEHLDNDGKQARGVTLAVILGAVLAIGFLLWMIFWQLGS